MPLLILYLVKLFISLALVYLFYQLALRKLTFYTWNRWYLLGYSILSFFIPFIDITPVLQNDKLPGNGILAYIPSVEIYTEEMGQTSNYAEPVMPVTWDNWDWILFIFFAGAGFLLLRLLIRYLSFRRMKANAELISFNGMKLYQVDKDIVPFSFGDSIFINRHLHNETELEKVIRHEFVHVKQKHTHDILFSELICILNWYNPFAWLIRRAIRYNLEFIADQKVIQNGFDRKQYQYLLLKVMGSKHFSIANQFNISSLKKRIAMMNKIKTAKVHLLRFFFLLPMLAVLLLAFRNQERMQGSIKRQPSIDSPKPMASFTDTVPDISLNEKGYYITIENNNVVVRDKNKKEVERLSLEKWNKNHAYYEKLYGAIPPPPPPAVPAPPAPPNILKENAKSVTIENERITVKLKNGRIEHYNLKNTIEKKAFEEKYGTVITAPTITVAAPAPETQSQPVAPPTPPADPILDFRF